MTIAEKLTTIAENEPKIYEAGVEKGKQAEYDAFWDSFQWNGTRARYDYGFYRFGAAGFSPKYDIIPTGSMLSFMQYFGSDGVTIDVAERLAQNGVVLNTANVTNFYMAFYWTNGIKRLPTIDIRGASTTGTSLYSMFSNCYQLETIDEIIFPDDGVHAPLDLTFSVCENLKNVKISGTIGKTISFDYSPLTRDSIVSIVNALSPTVSGQMLILKKSAVNNAFEDGNATGSESQEWETLSDTKPNWTINLV